MESYTFKDLYFEQLNTLYSVEQQIVESFPKLMDVISSTELRESYSHYLTEVRQHIDKLETIFTDLKLNPIKEMNLTVKGILDEGNRAAQHSGNSCVKDSALIVVAQCLMHYKMALYGSTRTFATHLDYTKAVDLLQKALNEESESNNTLTKIAEGGLFTTGINELACKEKAYV